MNDEIQVKEGYAVEEVVALMSTLRERINLEEGELYALQKGMLRRVARQEEENGLRRIKIMEEAYEAAQLAARRLRTYGRGYRPDPALVVSAFVMHAWEEMTPEDADAVALNYLQRLFHPAHPFQGQAAKATDLKSASNRSASTHSLHSIADAHAL
ncbi:hypothetical protein [Candidatus Contendibacter odensensis]|uniref:Uncharacterized protein n=1 Tax=Candidatus Contendobacter odensis Run_B_J11 TaxID=1400861 RepID=A0A7U7G9Y2_9GAMM|nr:hypothetical protein [Candidatus Contendobacter odensis]CDH44628.1 hypothetical protein BN874_1780005 [Candidatus Contendobacter odensis Run_B_J11]